MHRDKQAKHDPVMRSIALTLFEQGFGHLKDEFFRGQHWHTFEEFKQALNDYVIHWNTRRRQVKLKGLTPEEFRNQSLMM